MKLQQSWFKPRSPDSKFSAPSGFQHENLNYKDHPGLLIRMRSLHSKRAPKISRTSGQSLQQNEHDDTKHNHHLLSTYYVLDALCRNLIYLPYNTARRQLSFCTDKGNKGSKKPHKLRPVEDLNQGLPVSKACAPAELRGCGQTKTAGEAHIACFSSGSGLTGLKKRRKVRHRKPGTIQEGPTGLGLGPESYAEDRGSTAQDLS